MGKKKRRDHFKIICYIVKQENNIMKMERWKVKGVMKMANYKAKEYNITNNMKLGGFSGTGLFLVMPLYLIIPQLD